MERVLEETTGIRRHLRDKVDTYYTENFQESMRMTLGKTGSNEGV